MDAFKVIVMDAATAYERGVQYGQQAKDEIDIAVNFYKKKFDKKYTWEQIAKLAEDFKSVSAEFYPDAVEEIKGIADGSGRSVAEIMMVNARYEISQFNWQHECTTGVFIDPGSGRKFIFKNCDLGLEVKKHLVILHVKHPDGFKALCVAEAGQLIRDGYNSCGVALVNSAMRSHYDGPGLAVPGTIVRQRVWDSKSFDEACGIQRGMKRTVSTNMLIACKDGRAIDFECYPQGEFEVLPHKGIIGTGNRFTIEPDLNREVDPALDRGNQMRFLLGRNRQTISAAKLQELLKDHHGYPESICRHADEIGHSTVYSIIIDMAEDKIYICNGCPCKGEYAEYIL